MLRVWALLLLTLPLCASDATLRNDLIPSKAQRYIETIADELESKTGIRLYLIATNEHFPQGYNLVEHLKHYKPRLKEPYVVLIMAPFATIKEGYHARGRIGVIAKPKEIESLFDKDEVKEAAIDVLGLKDSNTLESKVTVATLQSVSVLAEQIANAKGVSLKSAIKNEMKPWLWTLRFIVYLGSVIVLWFFVIKPLVRRFKGA